MDVKLILLVAGFLLFSKRSERVASPSATDEDPTDYCFTTEGLLVVCNTKRNRWLAGELKLEELDYIDDAGRPISYAEARRRAIADGSYVSA